jgi:hypothetical protein
VNCPAGRTGRCLRYQYQGLHDIPGHTVAQNDAHNADLYRTFAPVPEVYERYYVKLDKIDASQPYGFFGPSAKQHYWKLNGATGYPSFVFGSFQSTPYWQIGSQQNPAITCPNGSVDVACNNYANLAQISMLDGQWHCVESHIKLNTVGMSDGQLDVWIDGTHTVGLTGNWRSSLSSTAEFVSFETYRQGSDNMYRYEDDDVVATTRIGCAGSPSVDSMPPKSPRGLRVQ